MVSSAKKKSVPARKKVLHIEAGQPDIQKLHPFFRNGEEWTEVRVNSDPSSKPNYTGNMRDFSTVPDGSMEGVWINQKLQLLFHHEVVPMLRECYRVLKQDGVVMFSVPNVTRVAEEICNDRLEATLFEAPEGSVSAIDILHGHRSLLQKNGEKAAHHTSFSANTAAGKLQQAGFRNLQVRIDNYVLWVAGSKIGRSHPAYNTEPNILNYSNRSNTLPDELDVPPVQWTPLGLKKSS